MAGRRADDKNIEAEKPDRLCLISLAFMKTLNVISIWNFCRIVWNLRAGTVRAREVLEMVELSGKRRADGGFALKGHTQQRLCLARAMIHKRSFWCWTNRIVGLDPRSRKFFAASPAAAREDYTILISSHILSELADLCTSIGVINGGVMVQQGKLENIMLAVVTTIRCTCCAEPGAKGAGTIAAGSAGQPPFCG